MRRPCLVWGGEELPLSAVLWYSFMPHTLKLWKLFTVIFLETRYQVECTPFVTLNANSQKLKCTNCTYNSKSTVLWSHLCQCVSAQLRASGQSWLVISVVLCTHRVQERQIFLGDKSTIGIVYFGCGLRVWKLSHQMYLCKITCSSYSSFCYGEKGGGLGKSGKLVF